MPPTSFSLFFRSRRPKTDVKNGKYFGNGLFEYGSDDVKVWLVHLRALCVPVMLHSLVGYHPLHIHMQTHHSPICLSLCHSHLHSYRKPPEELYLSNGRSRSKAMTSTSTSTNHTSTMLAFPWINLNFMSDTAIRLVDCHLYSQDWFDKFWFSTIWGTSSLPLPYPLCTISDWTSRAWDI